jgi:serine/threonine-protein kinase
VTQDDTALRELAAAMLDGTPIDWASAESSAVDESMRTVVRQLRVIAEIAELHGSVRQGDAADAEPAPQRLQTWSALRLLEQVGEGAFGEVYRAWDTRLDREVALKLLHRQDSVHARAASVVVDEGRMLAQVRHPNVVTVHGADRSDGRVGLWMEFIHGRTLEQVLKDQGPFEPADATQIGLDLCRALSAVHRAGLLHRDIKAHNVMREDGGRIVLMDFGTGLDDACESGDSAHSLAGTPLYMAPEVLDGRGASIQSDIYAVGVLLYRLVTGSYPVRGRSVQDVRDMHARGERTPLRSLRPDLPRGFIQVVEHAIDLQPERRYENAAALEAALISLEPRSKLVRLGYALGGVAAFLLVAGLAWEIVGRQVGVARTPSALVAGFAGVPRDAGAVSSIERPVIAVLPFKNLSAEPDSDDFADGLTDEVIRNLSVIDGLGVRSSTSSFAFKNKPRNTREVGELLNANLVVEGSVLRAGKQLRINAQLVRVADDTPLWSERFDRELKDIFAIQDEISRAIVDKLRLTLGRGQRRYETNLEAYDLFMRGRALIDRRGPASAQRAAELFERAIASDSEFAPAHAGLANAYAFWSFPFRGISFEKAYPIMRPAAVRALQLDPLLADAHAAMGWVYAYEHDWANAKAAFQNAIRLNPSLTQAYTSYSISTLQSLREYDEAMRILQLASRHDPLSLDVRREIGQVQLFSGRYEDAIDTFRGVVDIEPGFPFVQTLLARGLTFTGRAAEAFGGFGPGSPYLAQAFVMTGRRGEAEKLAAESESYPFRLAIIAAALGDPDRVADAVERTAVSEPHRVGRLLNEPELAPFHGHPRVVAVRRKFGLP